ncbi:unnamed protein product [Rhizophagus irregularis]|uniref:Uncharacterized protein n=1 Tax=Rhizophagus irregularis TaxID=588596 RepID=A0A2N1MAL8_9GLOM|nr:hypothetical protein RhiirC2_795977 [Rhizophagus irregularis]CAB5366360.1 unnamed protein product [Rhizophagus irregularis]
MHNTRSKVSKHSAKNDQYDKHGSSSDKANIEEVYGTDEDGAPDRINTKRSKKDETTIDDNATSQQENAMNIDPPETEEHQLSSETDVPSRDQSNVEIQTPINNEPDNMHIDQHNNNTNGDSTTSTSLTQQTQKDNISPENHNNNIFKEYCS